MVLFFEILLIILDIIHNSLIVLLLFAKFQLLEFVLLFLILVQFGFVLHLLEDERVHPLMLLHIPLLPDFAHLVLGLLCKIMRYFGFLSQPLTVDVFASLYFLLEEVQFIFNSLGRIVLRLII